MLTRDQLISSFAEALGVPQARVNRRYVEARVAGLLPKGSARRSPEYNLSDLATLVVAVALDDPDAERTRAYLALPHHCEGSGLTAGESIAGILDMHARGNADERSAAGAGTVTICRSWPEVAVELGGRAPDHFTSGHTPGLALGNLWRFHRVLDSSSPFTGSRSIVEIPGTSLGRLVRRLGLKNFRAGAEG